MDPMLITYIVTAATGIFAIASIVYFIKNKRFIGRRGPLMVIASILVFAMGILGIVKGIPITQVQYLIESTFK